MLFRTSNCHNAVLTFLCFLMELLFFDLPINEYLCFSQPQILAPIVGTWPVLLGYHLFNLTLTC